MHKHHLIALTTALFMLFSSALYATTVVIVNTANPDASISKKVAKKIFMGKKTSTGSTEVIPVDQSEGSTARDDFYKKAAKKSPEKMKSYWSKMIFSGRAQPPKVISGDAAIIDWVKQNKNAIGYVDSSSVNSSVKLILELP
ncbi:hypothetical protein MNBD_GAMMA07-1696 [hydrothermal vent metagenome]|uniref:ABC-type phosphate transport system, periplasmic component n=1 Tax=hydrothermal vent metagenome TaxID=652676 RepID=A0A3B0WZG7_9ZZZZ